ncbi:tetratricopeptide repeat protein [Solimonas marina]|uniref:Tetratricopeptide repeat protein n=1 Tax=Solimonas marina TaxID=2714601 RepID=A0A969WDZ3_9GAMM|nr:tetratricopeptide repeat protein [Solimonas marina]NKF23626.1 tetratricopeptide repeat protein [Solimonas marina]
MFAACATVPQPKTSTTPAAPPATAPTPTAPVTPPPATAPTAPPEATPAPAPDHNSASAATAQPPIDEEAAAEAQYHVMAGEMAAGRQQPAIAAQEFIEALQTVADPELARRATGLAIAAGDEGLAMQAAQRWLQVEPTAMEPREVIARVAISHGDLQTATEQVTAIVDGHAGGTDDGLHIAASILSQAKTSDADAAIAVMQKLAAKYPKTAAAPHAVALVALRFKRDELADRASQQALARAPDSRDEQLLRIGVLTKLGRISESDAMMDKLARKTKNADDLRLAYAKLLLESNQREPARTQLHKVLDHTANQPDAMFALAVMAINDHDYDTAESYLKALLDGERSEDAAFQLGRLYEAKGDNEDALDYYDRVDHGPQAIEAAVRQSFVLAKLGKIDEARDQLHLLRDNFPQFAKRFTLSEAELLLDANRNDDALQTLDDALKQQPDDNDLLYSRSLVYERLNRIDDAEKDLRKIIASQPDDPRALNALGYMLAVHTKRLDEAHDLISRALKLDPSDASIIDSMGWVEYKRGNTEAASQLLKRAFADFPDPEVAAHLGEVLWTQGHKDEARGIWDQALRANPNHPVLKATVERFEH